MLDISIGFASSIVLVVLFSLIEKKRIPSLGFIKYMVIILITLFALAISPTNHPLEWCLLLLMSYTAIDDLKTKTVFVPIYFLMIFISYFLGRNLHDYVFALVVFGIFFLFSKKTKENLLSLGDVYAILAVAVWFKEYTFVIILLALFIASFVIQIISLFKYFEYYSFIPFLTIAIVMVFKNIYVFDITLVLLCLNLFLYIFFRIRVKKNHKKWKNKTGK